MDVEDLSNLNSEYESNSQSRRSYRNYIPSSSILNFSKLKSHLEWKSVVTGLLFFIIFLLIIVISMVADHEHDHYEEHESNPSQNGNILSPEAAKLIENEMNGPTGLKLEARDNLNVSWVNYLRTNYSRNALKDAMSAGFDNGFDVFVISTFYNHEWIPGKLIHHQNQLDWIHSFFPIDGTEVQIDHFKLLVDPDKKLKWTPVTPDTNLEEGGNAVVGGRTRGGEHLYIGRTKKSGSDICGKVVSGLHTLFYTWQGKVESTQNFDILVFKS